MSSLYTKTYGFPIRASILVTNRCIYRCKHCYTSAGDLKFNELSTSQWKSVMDELEENGIFELYTGGGEPFVRKDIFDLFDYALNKKRFAVTTSTDGALVTRDRAKRIDDRISVQVSIDGVGQIHELIRGSSTYERSIRGLTYLLEAGKNVCVGTVVSGINQYDLPNIYGVLHDLGVPTWHIMRVHPAGRSLINWNRLSLTNDEWVTAVRTLEKISNPNQRPELCINGTFEVEEAKKINPEDAVFYFAPEAGLEICILPNGDVIPADIVFTFSQYRMGNILQEPLKDIWKKARVTEKFLETTKKIRGKCNECEVFAVCRGGSRINAEVLTGDLYAPDPYCPHEPPNYVKYK